MLHATTVIAFDAAYLVYDVLLITRHDKLRGAFFANFVTKNLKKKVVPQESTIDTAGV